MTAWMPMKKVLLPDPALTEEMRTIKPRCCVALIVRRKRRCSHLWRGALPTKLRCGVHQGKCAPSTVGVVMVTKSRVIRCWTHPE